MIKSTSDSQKAKLQAAIDKLQEMAKKKMGQVEKYNQDHVPEAIYVFITFQSMNGKEKFLEALKVSKCRRCALICNGRKSELSHKYIGKHWPDVRKPVDPSLIEWKNLGVSPLSRFIRQVIVYFMCLIIIVICFAGIVQGIFTSNNTKQWSPIACGT